MASNASIENASDSKPVTMRHASQACINQRCKEFSRNGFRQIHPSKMLPGTGCHLLSYSIA
eukprot:3304365-Amphidinium_carterae.1